MQRRRNERRLFCVGGATLLCLLPATVWPLPQINDRAERTHRYRILFTEEPFVISLDPRGDRLFGTGCICP